MICNLFVIVLVSVVCGMCLGASAADWPVYRHDAALSGVSPGRGSINKPAVKWQYYLGVPYRTVSSDARAAAANSADLDDDGKIESIVLKDRTVSIFDKQGQALWSYQVDEKLDGAIVRICKLLPNVKGMQLVIFTCRMDGEGNGQGYCFAFDRGGNNGRLAWRTGPMTGYHAPTLVIDDVDGDGLLEIVLAPHYRVQIFDSQTGKIKAEVPWDVGRNYGALVTRARPGHSHKDIFIVCDFVLHVDCIRFIDGKWTHAWGHKYVEPNAPLPQGREKYIKVGPNPVADVDGDGKDEMVYMLVEAEAGDEWRLIVRDCETGQVKADVPGTWLWSVMDLNGDNKAELVYTITHAKRPPTYTSICIGHVSAGKLVKLSEVQRVRPVLVNTRLPLNEDSIADEGLNNILCLETDKKKPPALVFSQKSRSGKDDDTIAAVSLGPDGKLVDRWHLQRPGHLLNVVEVDPEHKGGPLLRIRDLTINRELVINAEGKVIKESDLGKPGGFTTMPIAVDLDGDGACEIVVQNAAGEILALKPGKHLQDPPTVLWSTPGAAMSASPGYVRNGGLCPQAGDVDGDGHPEVVFASEAKSGNCALTCVDSSGKLKWSREVEGCPWGGLQAGVDNWVFGRFTGRKNGLDVYACIHRRSKGSGEAWVFRGDTGEVVWQRKSMTTGSEALPFSTIPAVFDVNADGIDDLVQAPFTIYGVLSGKTGEPVFPPAYMPAPEYFGKWIAYISPTVADLNSDGKPEVYLNSGSYARGGYAAVHISGKPLWVEFHDNLEGSNGLGPVSDFDGDGKVEIGVPVLNGTLLCLNGADGSRRWKIPANAAGDVIAADINGDGVTEMIFSETGGKIRAVSGKDGREIWSIDCAGQPIAADVDGDGYLELIVVDPRSSMVKLIGQKQDV